MIERLRKLLLDPLFIAGLLTWLAVALAMRFMAQHQALGWVLLVSWLLALVVHELLQTDRPWLRNALLLFEALAALTLIWLDPRPGTAQVLLVIWVTQLAAERSLRVTLVAALLADIAYYLILRDANWTSPMLVVMINAGFQGFAMMCSHYARSAEQARDQLARVNADLLATRALLADAARDAERLRVARELHDVAGHKLTAMTLNLRALATDPELAARSEVRVAQQLSAELLGDIRNVVQALRDSRGLDLATALRALAAPLPRPLLRLQVDEDVRVDDPCLAEAILRIVQEALTNAARHAGADTLRVSLLREGDALLLAIEDDGRVRNALREGNGLTGMRERIEGAGGTVAFTLTAKGSMRIDARLPA
nr:histidine kinase [Lysobacter psychrotolerans]